MALDLSGLKSDIRTLLSTANDTAAAYDLSTGLSQRVVSVNAFNPEKLRPSSSHLPGVFIWTTAKKATQVTINQTLAAGKRKADVMFMVAGVVWEPYTTTITEDPADDECEILMENIEEVLRSSDTLGGKAKWHMEGDVTYHTAAYDEEAHLRVGLMSLVATVYY